MTAHNPCWRGECRTACYYPETCSETPTSPDGGGLTEAEREALRMVDELANNTCTCGGIAACFPCQTADAITALLAARSTAPDTEATAEAWDEGFGAGHETARAVNPEYPEPTSNPYRRAAAIREGSDT